MEDRYAVILAAGKGTRMKSKQYKVLHEVCGLPMVEHVVRAVKESHVSKIVTIVGHGAQAVQEVLGNQSQFVLQEEQLGTGHAVLQAKAILGNREGHTLVICGDTPLLSGQTLAQLFDTHLKAQAQATILTAVIDDPTGYGRVIRNNLQEVIKIVEQKDGNEQELRVKEINTGTYIFNNQVLFDLLGKVTNDNAQGEYYLPDVIGLIQAQNGKIVGHQMADIDESLGINDRVALAQATQIMRQRILRKHMVNGVTIQNPLTTLIEADVVIGADTVIESGVSLKGKTSIGQSCIIGMNSEIVDSQIADQVQITQSVIEQSSVKAGTTIGPFAHLRPNSHLGQNVHIGNFVEVKNSTVGDETKAGHLTYVGDSDLGQNINIGCGTIFVNYDGKKKHRSTVGNDVFIGCNANIVSPVTIGDRAFIAAGTTVTQDIEEEALAISRVKQENIANYWQKLQNK